MVAQYGSDVAPIDGPLSVRYEFILARPKSVAAYKWFSCTKPDIDNLEKSFQDAMDFQTKWTDGTVMGVMANDSRVSCLSSTKRYAICDEVPGTTFSICQASSIVMLYGEGITSELSRIIDPTVRALHMDDIGRTRKVQGVDTIYVMLGGGRRPDMDMVAKIRKCFPDAKHLYAI